MEMFFVVLSLMLWGTMTPSELPAAAAEDLVRALPDDCEVVAFVDLRGAADQARTLIADLAARPWMNEDADTREAMEWMSTGMDETQAEMTALLGFDPFETIDFVSFCASFSTADGSFLPSGMLVVQGDLPESALETVAGMVGMLPSTLSNGQSAFVLDGGPAFTIAMGWAADGVAIVGTESYVAPRLAGPVDALHTQDSPLGRVYELAPQGVRWFFGFSPGTATRLLISSESPVTLGQLVAGIRSALWVNGDNSSVIELIASDAASSRDHELILTGLGALAEATPLAYSAAVRMIFAVLSPDDRDLPDVFRSMARHRDDLIEYLDSIGILNEPEVNVEIDAATSTTRLSINNSNIFPLLTVSAIQMAYLTLGRGDSYESYGPSDTYPPDPYYYYDEPAIEEVVPPQEAPEPANPW